MSLRKSTDENVPEPDVALGRRSFLRGSALFAIAAGLASTVPALAQSPRDEHATKADGKRDNQSSHEKQDEKNAEKKGDEAAKQEPAPEGESEPQVLRDATGREYRECPQCGSNMYQQGRTWTCENCGYSYVE